MCLDFVIVERGGGVGGTWYWNNYPGIGCDVPSHLYSFSFFRRSSWTLLYSGGGEINQYLTEFWKWAKLESYTTLNTEVVKVNTSKTFFCWVKCT